MSGNHPPPLPPLPSGFGMDSSYPPMPGSSRITASQPNPSLASYIARPTAPPVPGKVAAAHHHEQPFAAGSHHSHHSPGSQGLRPGQYLNSPQVTPSPYRTPSPQPPLPPSSAHYGYTAQQQLAHAQPMPQPGYLMPMPVNSSSSGLGPPRQQRFDHGHSPSFQPQSSPYGQHLVEAPRRYSAAVAFQSRPVPLHSSAPERAHTPIADAQHQHQAPPQP